MYYPLILLERNGESEKFCGFYTKIVYIRCQFYAPNIRGWLQNCEICKGFHPRKFLSYTDQSVVEPHLMTVEQCSSQLFNHILTPQLVHQLQQTSQNHTSHNTPEKTGSRNRFDNQQNTGSRNRFDNQKKKGFRLREICLRTRKTGFRIRKTVF